MGRGLVEKREAIIRGARTVFGGDGYTRASIGAIASAAGVSTRTIYNHFPGGKAELFRLVVQEGSKEILRVQLDIVDRWLHKVTDVELDLIDFGKAWVAPLDTFASHFALVRQLRAEIEHLPPDLLRAWEEVGPRRVQSALADRFQELADEGRLVMEDPRQAAIHFTYLVSGEIRDRTYDGALPLAPEVTNRLVTVGVQTFLRGYLPR
ncbi:TetR/AcrR family transcriptional regulator C-terminal domain-containing protein [Streptomyces marincola]|uniref:TetR/AcrR family transcriptional regulator C-terminal domain-containing protein n=1 Tax=Streptomyces marincola TaxID=2878388 RepID=UPI001CF3C42D|nr:TetR/AcrR family transcriptional regulator C-terminal domain-containing protein [Streptomyces marincola]UCM87089.1 TetR/AcrR family transcriptional regulator C-terminal domain-containing protein [Streptomyces marincola]